MQRVRCQLVTSHIDGRATAATNDSHAGVFQLPQCLFTLPFDTIHVGHKHELLAPTGGRTMQCGRLPWPQQPPTTAPDAIDDAAVTASERIDGFSHPLPVVIVAAESS